MRHEDWAHRFRGKNVLITGGLGFIGSNLARELVRHDAKVVLVDSLIPEYGGNLFNVTDIADRVTINIADMRDEHGVGYLVRNQDFVFNLAGQTSHMDSMTDPFTDLEINCRAQLYLLEACRKANPEAVIVFASTRQFYGKPEYLPVDERHPLHATDINGIHKLAGESYHLLYHDVYGMRTTALRLTNTYGPRMRVRDARQTFLGIWIRAVVEGKPFEVWEGDQLRDFTYVNDAVEALLLAATNEQANGQAFNVGGHAPLSLAEVGDLLLRIVPGSSRTTHTFPEERKRIDIGSYYADYSKIQDALGWSPRTDLAEGLARTVEYYRRHLAEYV